MESLEDRIETLEIVSQHALVQGKFVHIGRLKISRLRRSATPTASGDRY